MGKKNKIRLRANNNGNDGNHGKKDMRIKTLSPIKMSRVIDSRRTPLPPLFNRACFTSFVAALDTRIR